MNYNTETLLEKEQLLAIAQPFPRRLDGVYFLIDGDEVVYVGITSDIHNRIIQHIQENKKVFNRYAFIECEDGHCEIEANYIAKLKPKYNKKLVMYDNSKRWKNTKKIKRDSGLVWKVFNDFVQRHNIETYLHCIDTFAFNAAFRKEFGHDIDFEDL